MILLQQLACIQIIVEITQHLEAPIFKKTPRSKAAFKITKQRDLTNHLDQNSVGLIFEIIKNPVYRQMLPYLRRYQDRLLFPVTFLH